MLYGRDSTNDTALSSTFTKTKAFHLSKGDTLKQQKFQKVLQGTMNKADYQTVVKIQTYHEELTRINDQKKGIVDKREKMTKQVEEMELQSVDASEKQKLKELKDFVAIETEKME